jgi:hypothetical protein
VVSQSDYVGSGALARFGRVPAIRSVMVANFLIKNKRRENRFVSPSYRARLIGYASAKSCSPDEPHCTASSHGIQCGQSTHSQPRNTHIVQPLSHSPPPNSLFFTSFTSPSHCGMEQSIVQVHQRALILDHVKALYGANYPVNHTWAVITTRTSQVQYKSHVIVYDEPGSLRTWKVLITSDKAKFSEGSALEKLLKELTKLLGIMIEDQVRAQKGEV